MPRFYYQERATSHAPVAATIQAASRTLSEIGGKPMLAGPRVTSELGGWLRTRTVGGMWAPAKWLPVVAVVDVIDYGDRREIVVNVAERMGFGSLIGMEGRLRQHCSDTARYIRDMVVYKLATGVEPLETVSSARPATR